MNVTSGRAAAGANKQSYDNGTCTVPSVIQISKSLILHQHSLRINQGMFPLQLQTCPLFTVHRLTTHKMMINPEKLIKLARKWQRVASLRRKRISLPGLNASSSSAAPVADKGHFVVYTADQRRFVLPISYLSNQIFQELLRMSEEEFGLPGNGPITLPCDAVFFKYAVSLIQGCVDRHLQEAYVMSIVSSRCSSWSHSLHHGQISQPLIVCSC